MADVCGLHGLQSSFKAAFRVSISSKKLDQLIADVISVLLGIKPALLVDCAHTSGEKFQILLSDILHHLEQNHNRTSSTTSDLSRNSIIIEINGDVLLVNLEGQNQTSSLECVDCKRAGDWPLYVNVEQGIDHYHTLMRGDHLYSLIEGTYNKVCDELQVAIQSNLSPVEHKYAVYEPRHVVPILKEMKTLEHQNDFNLCTLFGRLLGYPVVYWFDPNKGYSLSMVDLVLYTVTANSRDDFIHRIFKEERIVYSFSVPKCLQSAVTGSIASWFHRVRSLGDVHGLDMKLESKTVCLPSVAL